jgi:K+-sensing histidine kinase KdpD
MADALGQLLHDPRIALIVCPDNTLAITRMLILDSWGARREGFLTCAARLAASFAVRPVVLTVARSETAARQRQRSAREILMAQGVDGDLDFVVGSEVRTALAGVARWRRSQLVVVERQGDSPRWRWSRGPTMEKLIGISTSLVFLALPEAGIPEPRTNGAHAPSVCGRFSALPADRRSV